MNSLLDVLKLIGYENEAEFIAYVKLMAYRGIFSNPFKFINENNYDLLTYKKFANEVAHLWKQTFIEYGSIPDYQFKLITDAEAKSLLNIRFSSLESGFYWLHYSAEIFCLRREFFLEGINVSQDVHNTKRWNQKDVKITKEIYEGLYQCALTLNLIDVNSWPNDKKIDRIVLVSSIEYILKKRLESIDSSYEGIIDCLSGPRGVFNYEPALAKILAMWFKAQEKENLIQEVLNKYLASDLPLQWTGRLSELKKELLLKLGRTEWPNVDSYYYKDKKLYDEAARLANREPLDCLGGPWPVAMDILELYAKGHFKNFDKIILNPVITLGKNGKLAGLNDVILNWYQKHGKNIISQGLVPAFVACNSVQVILNNLSSQEPYQESILLRSLYVKATKIKKVEYNSELLNKSKNFNPIIITVNTEKMILNDLFDNMAKALFDFKKNLVVNIKENEASKIEKNLEMRELYVSRVKRYMQSNQLKLSDSALNLGIYYRLKHNHIKYSGLINFVENILRKSENDEINKIIKELRESTILNMKYFIEYFQQRYGYRHSNIDIEAIKENDQKNLQHLCNLRRKIFEKFQSVENLITNDSLINPSIRLISAINNLYKFTFNSIKHFVIALTEQAIELIQCKSEVYALAFLGSHGSGYGTPYSDIESFMIIQHKKSAILLRQMIKLQLLKILNLGETILPSLGIPGLEVGKVFDNNRQGLAYDRNQPNSCKTPLGRKENEKVVYRLLGTISDLSNLSHNTEYDFIFPALFRSSKFVSGNLNLYNEFNTDQRKINNRLNFNKRGYLLTLFKKDLDNSIFYINDFIRSKSTNDKRTFYRPIQVLIDNLYRFIDAQDELEIDPFQKIKRLYKLDLINYNQKMFLIQNLTLVMYIRIKQVLTFNELKFDISKNNSEFSILYHSEQLLRSVLLDFSSRYDAYDRKIIMEEGSLAISVHNSSILNQYNQNLTKANIENSLIKNCNPEKNVNLMLIQFQTKINETCRELVLPISDAVQKKSNNNGEKSDYKK